MRNKVFKFVKRLTIIILSLLVIAGGYGYYFVHKSLPTVEGKVEVAMLVLLFLLLMFVILKKGIHHNIVAFLFLIYSILLLIFSLGILFISCIIYFYLGIRIILIRNREIK